MGVAEGGAERGVGVNPSRNDEVVVGAKIVGVWEDVD